jgi:hypothetical protein
VILTLLRTCGAQHQSGANATQQKKSRRTDVCDPAREKQRQAISGRHVERLVQLPIPVDSTIQWPPRRVSIKKTVRTYSTRVDAEAAKIALAAAYS